MDQHQRSQGYVIKINGGSVEHYAIKLCDLMHTPALLDRVKRSDNEMVQIRMV